MTRVREDRSRTGGLLEAADLPGSDSMRAQVDRRQVVRDSTPWIYSLILHLIAMAFLFDLALSSTEIPPPREVEVRIVTFAEGDDGDLGQAPVAPEDAAEEDEPETVESEEPVETETLPEQSASAPMAPRDDPVRREPAPPTEEELQKLFGVGGRPLPMQGEPDAASAAEARSMLEAVVTHEPRRGVPAAYALRTSRGRAAGVAAGGGTPGSESAVESGLDWLAAHQHLEGSWRLHEYDQRCPPGSRCKGVGYRNFTVGGTALATLAFLGAGYHHLGEGAERGQPGFHASTVDSALSFLRNSQNDDGSFGERGVNMYNHAIATLAMTEAYGLTHDSRLRRRIERAIAFLISSQEPAGGWNYTPHARLERNDSSITGWVVMALHAARIVGISVPERTLQRARRFLARMTAIDGHVGYADTGQNAFRDSLALLPVGLFVEQLMGSACKDARSRAQVAELVSHPPRWSETPSLDRSLYYVYYGTLAMHFTGGDAWRSWNEALLLTLVPSQSQYGHERGSWDPISKWANKHGGRVYSTAVAVLCLEIYYKYQPGYMRRPKLFGLPAGGFQPGSLDGEAQAPGARGRRDD